MATLHSQYIAVLEWIFFVKCYERKPTLGKQICMLIVYNYYIYPSLKYYSGFLFFVLWLNNKMNIEIKVRSGDESRGPHVGRTKAQLTADQFATLIVANWLPLSSPPPFTHHITLHVLHCYAELLFRFTVHASVVTFVSNTRQQLFFEEIFFNSREESVSSVKVTLICKWFYKSDLRIFLQILGIS